jgi:hypothetical protein
LEIAATCSLLALLGSGYMGYSIFKKTQQMRLLEQAVYENPLNRMYPKITWCKYLENVNGYGTQLANQYATIIKLHASTLKILSQKFDVKEITFARYQQTIESTNLLLTDNLWKLIPLLETLDSISKNDLPNQSVLIQKIDTFFSMNDELLERLNDLVINLSAIKSLTGPDESTSKFLLENLEKMILRAKQY